jgi:hypothetical protein
VDSNSEGGYFTEMAREPVRQDTKPVGARDYLTGCRHQVRGKEKYYRLNFVVKSCFEGLTKGSEMTKKKGVEPFLYFTPLSNSRNVIINQVNNF